MVRYYHAFGYNLSYKSSFDKIYSSDIRIHHMHEQFFWHIIIIFDIKTAKIIVKSECLNDTGKV